MPLAYLATTCCSSGDQKVLIRLSLVCLALG
jgi:hypothetical protein